MKPIGGRFLTLAGLALGAFSIPQGAAVFGSEAPLSAQVASIELPCDRDPWVADLRDRVMAFDPLFVYAVEQYGSPLNCEGAARGEFDGVAFGGVRLELAGGASFEFETMAPETTIVTLRAPAGFLDPISAYQALEAYTEGFGLRIDWSTPTVTEQGAQLVQTFWDPDPGLNGSASLVFLGDTLVALRFSVAL